MVSSIRVTRRLKVIEAISIRKQFDGKKLINDFSVILQKGDRIGIIGENEDLYTFLKERSTGNYIVISFFPKEEFDYTARQTKYTVVYNKEKTNSKTNERVVLHNSQEELIQTAK